MDATQTPPTVALLGTGTMGAAMGRTLLAAGIPLRAWNRTPERARPLADDGAEVVATPADAVRGADVVMTMLGDAADVLAVMEQAADGLVEDQVWLQTTTVGPGPLAGLASFADEHGLMLLDAPVSGTREPAEKGALTVLVAGPREVQPLVQPVLDAIGSRTLWLGEKAREGAASRLKLVVNSWVIAINDAAGEAVALARGLGVDPQAFLDLVADGPLDLPYLRLKAGKILADDLSPSFSVAMAAKDAALVVEAARDAGLRLDGAAAARARLTRAAAAGHGQDDMAASYLASYPREDDEEE
ncbi:MAG TPA: NAD(P)-dependent oxidoreductase [Marmoricola sp.]|nr:NAD(P)-dependent oxidoreductase [Marmoricola sp.]